MEQLVSWSIFCLLVLLLCLLRLAAGRAFVGAFFLVMAVGVDVALVLLAPDLFVGLGTDAPSSRPTDGSSERGAARDLNARDLDRAALLYAEDCEYVNRAYGIELRGQVGQRANMRAFLGVGDAHARSRVPTQAGPQTLAKRRVEPLEGPLHAPSREPSVDGFPGRKVHGQ